MTIESTRAAYSTRVYDSSKLKTLLVQPFFTLEKSIDNALKGKIQS